VPSGDFRPLFFLWMSGDYRHFFPGW
jgi:hypothetical protein